VGGTDTGLRLWIDDPNAIFRRGIVACVSAAGCTVVGESSRFEPNPCLDDVDILIFDLDGPSLSRAIRFAKGTSARLVAIARDACEDVLFEAFEAGVCGFLPRADLSPDALVTCLAAVANGSDTVPSQLLARLLDTLAKGEAHGSTAGKLARREIDVLRLLAEGGDTREIAGQLNYSERTVKNIVHDVLVKMNCRSRAHAVALATRRGLI
jgi:DNA-binding NarL/FixJ family response regulator